MDMTKSVLKTAYNQTNEQTCRFYAICSLFDVFWDHIRKYLLILREVTDDAARKIKIMSILTCSFNAFHKTIEYRMNSFSGMNALCQLRPMLGYSYILPKVISYFSLNGVDFYCFIVFTRFKYGNYNLIQIRLPKTIFAFRKGHNYR